MSFFARVSTFLMRFGLLNQIITRRVATNLCGALAFSSLDSTVPHSIMFEEDFSSSMFGANVAAEPKEAANAMVRLVLVLVFALALALALGFTKEEGVAGAFGAVGAVGAKTGAGTGAGADDGVNPESDRSAGTGAAGAAGPNTNDR